METPDSPLSPDLPSVAPVLPQSKTESKKIVIKKKTNHRKSHTWSEFNSNLIKEALERTAFERNQLSIQRQQLRKLSAVSASKTLFYFEDPSNTKFWRH
jgi:hypothetical protein